MSLEAAITSFLQEFSTFETQSVSAMLGSLSEDPGLVEQSAELLDLESRLTLIKRLASGKDMPAALMAELEVSLTRARELHTQRDELARNVAGAKPGTAGHRKVTHPDKARAGNRRLAEYAKVAGRKKLWVPTIEQIRTYESDALDLQARWREMTTRFGSAAELAQS